MSYLFTVCVRKTKSMQLPVQGMMGYLDLQRDPLTTYLIASLFLSLVFQVCRHVVLDGSRRRTSAHGIKGAQRTSEYTRLRYLIITIIRDIYKKSRKEAEREKERSYGVKGVKMGCGQTLAMFLLESTVHSTGWSKQESPR